MTARKERSKGTTMSLGNNGSFNFFIHTRESRVVAAAVATAVEMVERTLLVVVVVVVGFATTHEGQRRVIRPTIIVISCLLFCGEPNKMWHTQASREFKTKPSVAVGLLKKEFASKQTRHVDPPRYTMFSLLVHSSFSSPRGQYV
jgi:hypothetical protein